MPDESAFACGLIPLFAVAILEPETYRSSGFKKRTEWFDWKSSRPEKNVAAWRHQRVGVEECWRLLTQINCDAFAEDVR